MTMKAAEVKNKLSPGEQRIRKSILFGDPSSIITNRSETAELNVTSDQLC